MPPQLEKNHVVPTAWQDEALARDGVSRVLKIRVTTNKIHATDSEKPKRRELKHNLKENHKPQKGKEAGKERNKEEIQKQLEKMFKMAINAYL